MELRYSNLDDNISMIKLIGKLDIAGVSEIESSFAGYCAGDGLCLLVDLSEVEFLASIGIRFLMLNGKSVAGRGGKMALLNPLPEVEHVLDVTGIPAIIPIYSDLDYAKRALLASETNSEDTRDPKKSADDMSDAAGSA